MIDPQEKLSVLGVGKAVPQQKQRNSRGAQSQLQNRNSSTKVKSHFQSPDRKQQDLSKVLVSHHPKINVVNQGQVCRRKNTTTLEKKITSLSADSGDPGDAHSNQSQPNELYMMKSVGFDKQDHQSDAPFTKRLKESTLTSEAQTPGVLYNRVEQEFTEWPNGFIKSLRNENSNQDTLYIPITRNVNNTNMDIRNELEIMTPPDVVQTSQLSKECHTLNAVDTLNNSLGSVKELTLQTRRQVVTNPLSAKVSKISKEAYQSSEGRSRIDWVPKASNEFQLPSKIVGQQDQINIKINQQKQNQLNNRRQSTQMKQQQSITTQTHTVSHAKNRSSMLSTEQQSRNDSLPKTPNVMVKVQSTRGHRNIRLMLSKDGVTQSVHSNTFMSKPLMKPKSQVRVPEFLKAALDEKRSRKTTSVQLQPQKFQPPRFAGTVIPSPWPQSPLTQGQEEEKPKKRYKEQPLFNEQVLQLQKEKTFKIADFIDYESTQQRLREVEKSKVVTLSAKKPDFSHKRSSVPQQRPQATDILRQSYSQKGEVKGEEHLESLIENSSLWMKSKQAPVSHSPSQTAKIENELGGKEPDLTDYSPQYSVTVPSIINEEKVQTAQKKRDRLDTQKKNFHFTDMGGTAVRGKIRIEMAKEDRRHQQAVAEVKHNYDFNEASQIPLIEVREANFMKAVMGQDAMIARDDLSTFEKNKEKSVDMNVSSLRDTEEVLAERANWIKLGPGYEDSYICSEDNIYFKVPAELEAWLQLKPEFKVDMQPCLTEYIFSDIVAQYTKEEYVDLFTPRMFASKLMEVEAGLSKYITLKLDHARDLYHTEYGSKSNHDTSDEEIAEAHNPDISTFGTSTNMSNIAPARPKPAQHKKKPTIGKEVILPDFIMPNINHNATCPMQKQKRPRHAGTRRDPLENRHEGGKGAFIGHGDFWMRRIDFTVCSLDTLTQVEVQLELNQEALFKLKKGVEDYNQRQIEKVLPISMFDDFKEECMRLKGVIENKRARNKPPVICQVQVVDSTGDEQFVRGKVEEYLPDLEKFIVNLNGFRYYSGRLAMQFEMFETGVQTEKRRQTAFQLQQETFQRVNFERMLFEEIMRMYPDIRQPPSLMLNIINRLAIKEIQQPFERISQLAHQVESTFVYAMVKLEIMRELEEQNPRFTCLINSYKEHRSTWAQAPYYALRSFEINGKPLKQMMRRHEKLDIMQNQSLLGRNAFNETAQIINDLWSEIMLVTPVFEIPLSRGCLNFCLSMDQFKGWRRQAIENLTNKFPQEADFFSSIQGAVAERFRLTLTGNWIQTIYKQVGKVLAKEFPQKKGKIISNVTKESQLNPVMVRFFRQVNSLQVSHLCHKQYLEMKKYLEFLVRFALQNEAFREHQIWEAFHLDRIVVPSSPDPLIIVDVRIIKKKAKIVPKKDKKNMKEKGKSVQIEDFIRIVDMQPRIEEVYFHFVRLTENLEDQFNKLTRIEHMFYPNLKLATEEFLGAHTYPMTNLATTDEEESSDKDSVVLDVEAMNDHSQCTMTTATMFSPPKGPTMSYLKKVKTQIGRSLDSCQLNLEVVRIQINKITSFVMEQADTQIMIFGKYTKYLNYDFQKDIIMKMKKNLHDHHMVSALAGDGNYDGGATLGGGGGGASDEGSNYGGDDTKQQHDPGESSEEDLEGEIRRIEIDPATYKENYEKMYNAYWAVQSEVSDEYNYGLVLLDCRKFKEAIVKKIASLLVEFKRHLVLKFNEVLTRSWEQNETIRRKVDKEWDEDIEENIKQMKLIESLACVEIFEELIERIKVVKETKLFLDSLRIEITEDQFEKFMSLYAFPQFLSVRVYTQFESMQETQKKISSKIASRITDANSAISQFEQRFNCFSEAKVMTKKEYEDQMKQEVRNRKTIQELIEKARLDGEISKAGSDDVYVWSSADVKVFTDRMEQLKKDVSDCEGSIYKINKQQEALGQKPTTFPALIKLKQSIMPTLTQVWGVIQQFNEKFFSWWTTPFPKLNIDEMEECHLDWIRKLQHVQKDTLFIAKSNANTFVDYILAQMDRLKDFMSIIIALKTKGLEKRHYVKMEKELEEELVREIEIVPHKMDLKYLSKQGLHKQNAVEIIKKYAAVAQKEYAIKCTLDGIDSEISNCFLKYILYRGEFSIFDGIEFDMLTFSDCDMKIATLQQSAYSKHYEGRISQVGKDIKYVIEFYKNWRLITKWWAYLLPIFEQEDIQKVMPAKCEQYAEVDTQYRKILNEAQSGGPITYRNFSRSGQFPHQSEKMMRQLDLLMFDINRYLIMKRRNFPRLYFMNNDELMQMVGNSTDEVALQADLFKLFPGIKKLHFSDEKVTKEVLIPAKKSRLKRQNAVVNKVAADQVQKKVMLFPRICKLENEQGEIIELQTPVVMEETLDVWCNKLEKQMEAAVNWTCSEAFTQLDDYSFAEFIDLFPTQMLLVALDARFTQMLDECIGNDDALVITKEDAKNKAIRGDNSISKENRQLEQLDKYQIQAKTKAKNEAMWKTLRIVKQKVDKNYKELVRMIKSQMNDFRRTKISNLVLNRIQQRDTLSTCIKSEFAYVQDFLSQTQLKYQFELVPQGWDINQRATMAGDEEIEARERVSQLFVKVFHVTKSYGYEFLSSTSRLVVTPLTERVYQSLLLAMYYDFGGAPYGPAGTGKTETVKDLAKRIARNSLAYNCQSGMDISQMAELLSGVCACGYWSCFDEFNRIDISVLQILSELFIKIQHTKRSNKEVKGGEKEIEIDGNLVPFRAECGLFVTMNPYIQGRSKLPSNLKNLFRIVTMIVPDTKLISQTVLMNYGFEKHVTLARKIVRSFQMAEEQLASQMHYDFGLRAIRQVLNNAGSLKLKALRITSDQDELQAVADQRLMCLVNNIKPLKKANEANSKRKNKKASGKEGSAKKGSLAARMGQVRSKGDTNPLSLMETMKNKGEDVLSIASKSITNEERDILKEAKAQKDHSSESEDERDYDSPTDRVTKISHYDDKQSHMTSSKMLNSSMEERQKKIDFELIQRMIDNDNTDGPIEKVKTEEELEDFICLKAVRDVQMPRLALEDQGTFINILNDMFPGTPKPRLFQEIRLKEIFPDPTNMGALFGSMAAEALQGTPEDQQIKKDIQFKLREITEQRLAEKQLESETQFKLRVIQLYEAIQSRHGIMIVGKPVTGKTTLLKIVKDISKILNKMEFAKRQKAFLKQKALKMGVGIKEDTGDNVRLENADPSITRKLLPTQQEKKIIAETQTFHEMSCQSINPKAMDPETFFGLWKAESSEWTDGCLTKLFRNAQKDPSSKLKIIVIDGPLEPGWVENLNSVLDDNKRLSYANGESIVLNDKMKVVLEASDMGHCSPATVSRCGVIYMEDHEMLLPLKGHVNRWIRSLPEILLTEADRLDQVINYFLFHMIEKFTAPERMIHLVSRKQVLSTFTQIMESQISDYRLEAKYDKKKYRKLLRTYWDEAESKNYDFGDYEISESEDEDKDKGGKKDKAETNEFDLPQSARLQTTRQVDEQPKSPDPKKKKQKKKSKMPPPKTTPPDGQQKDQFPSQKFADLGGQTYINSIRFKTEWMHCFFIFALIWSFGVNLREEFKPEFEEWIMNNCTASCQKEKSPKKPTTHATNESNLSGSNMKRDQNNDESISGEEEASDDSYQAEHILVDETKGGQFVIDPTTEITSGRHEALSTASYLPSHDKSKSIWDWYFDVEENSWMPWSFLKKCTLPDTGQKTQLLDFQQHTDVLFNNFWNTDDTIRYCYLIDRLINTKFHVMLIGPTGTGKSKLINRYAQKRMNQQNFIGKYFNVTGNCKTEELQEVLERGMQMSKTTKIYRPTQSRMTHLFFIDDLNMCSSDNFGIQGPIELLRSWMDYGGWFDTIDKTYSKMKNIQFCCTVSLSDDMVNQCDKRAIDERFMWKFALVTMINQHDNHLNSIYSQILSFVKETWPKDLQEDVIVDSIIKASFSFYKFLAETVLVSPISFTQRVNSRHLLSTLFGILDLYGVYRTDVDELAGIFIHENSRAMLDRFIDPRKHAEYYQHLITVTKSAFDCDMTKVSSCVTLPLFSYMKKDFSDIYTRCSQDNKLEINNLEEILDEYNQFNFRTPIEITLFDFMVGNIIKASRSLRQPWAGTILVANEGCGAEKVAKIAVMMTKFASREFGASSLRNYTREKWVNDLKSVMFQLVQEIRPIVLMFYEREIDNEAVLMDLDALMAHGEVLSLLSEIETDEIVTKMKTASQALSILGIDQSKKDPAFLDDFRQECLRNIKVMFMLTPQSKILRYHMRKFSHLLTCATCINLGDWGNQGLKMVAQGILEDTNKLGTTDPLNYNEKTVHMILEKSENKDKVYAAMLQVYRDVQVLTHRVAVNQGAQVYVSPSHFTQFCKHYKRIYVEQEVEFSKHMARFAKGLDGIQWTQNEINEVQEKLSDLSPQLVGQQHEIEENLRERGRERDAIEKRMEMLLLEEAALAYQQEEGKRVQETCHTEFASAIPILNKAVTGLQNLDKRDIDELRAFKSPPIAIKVMLKAVCLILKVEPKMIPIPSKINKFEEDYWTPAVGPHVLGSKNITQLLGAIDPTSLDNEVMKTLEELMSQPEFSFVAVDRSCVAAQGLFMWVRAVRNYYYVYKMNEQYRDKLVISDLQAEKQAQIIGNKRRQLEDLTGELDKLKKEFMDKEEVIKTFQKQIDECYIMKSRCSRLIDALGKEKRKWEVCMHLAEKKVKSLEGDCLLAAAMILYLAPFDQKIRDHFKNKWNRELEQMGIKCTKNLIFNQHFLPPHTIQSWIEKGLPNDSFSIQSAIIRYFCQIQVVILDPHQQARKWLNGMFPRLTTLNQDTDNLFRKQLKMHLSIDSCVIVENVADKLSKRLYPIIKKMNDGWVVGRDNEVELDGRMVTISPDFQLIITSVSSKPNFGPEISEHIVLVNFELTEAAFDAQMMALIVQEIESELEGQQRIAKKDALDYIEEIRGTEQRILKMLGTYKNAKEMLQNEDLIEQLQGSQVMQDKIGTKLKDIATSQAKLYKKQMEYAPLTRRATKLFFLVHDFSKLSPMYQFTHQWFFSTFLITLRQCLSTKQEPPLTLENIMKVFTRDFFFMVCSQIFDRDKMLFSFMLAYKTLEADSDFDFRQAEFFIKGPLFRVHEMETRNKPKKQDDSQNFERLTLKEQEKKRQKKAEILAKRLKSVNWITPETWKLLDKLSTVTPFNQMSKPHNDCQNLSAHIEKNQKAWNEYVYRDRIEEKEEKKRQADLDNMVDKNCSMLNDQTKDYSSMPQSDDSDDTRAKKLKNKNDKAKQTKSTEMPGGYETFDYHQAHLRKNLNKKVETHSFKSMKEGVKGLMSGKKEKNQQQIEEEKQLDEFFAANKDTSSDEDEEKRETGKTLNESSTDKLMHQLAGDEKEGQAKVHKNNLQDEMEIAESIICGIAQYSEMDVQAKDHIIKDESKLVVKKEMLRLCLMRCFRPDMLMDEIKLFIEKFLGPEFVGLPPFRFKEYIWPNTSRFRPVLVIQDDNIDAYEELLRIKAKSEAASTGPDGLKIVHCGSGNISKIARRAIECAINGHWLLLDNIHLCMSIIPNLQQFCADLASFHWNYTTDLNKKLCAMQAEDDKVDKLFLGTVRNRSGSELDELLDEKTVKRKQKEQEEQQAMMDFPEGRANFANEDSFFLSQCSKPSYMSERVLKYYKKRKKDDRAGIISKLTKMALHLDNPDPTYEDSVGRDRTSEEVYLEELQIPEGWNFSISKAFRMFISSLPLETFPANFARKCTKMCLQLPINIKRNAEKNFLTIGRSHFSAHGTFTEEFRKIMLSMCLLHAVINRKEQFGPFGWSKSGYEFSQNDFEISVSQIGEMIKNLRQDKRVPSNLIHHIIVYLNYGSVVTNAEDLKNLHEVAKVFINQEIFATDPVHRFPMPYDLTGGTLDSFTDFRLQGGRHDYAQEMANSSVKQEYYTMPARIQDRGHMQNWVHKQISNEDQIEIFGLGKATEFKANERTAFELMRRMYHHQFVIALPQNHFLQPVHMENKLAGLNFAHDQRYSYFMKKMDEVHAQLRHISLNELEIERSPLDDDYGAAASWTTFLVKEKKQFVILVDKIMYSLKQTYDCLEGIRSEDDLTMACFEAIQSNQTPLQWIQMCYPSFKVLSVFITNLVERIKYLEDVITKTNNQEDVRSFNFGLFYDQKAFFTTLLQQVSRKANVSIETLNLIFRVMGPNEHQLEPKVASLSHSYYLDGLFLNGARWRKEEGTIDEAEFMHQITTKLPAIHLTVKKPELPLDKSITASTSTDVRGQKSMQTNLADALKKEKPLVKAIIRNESLTTKIAPKIPEVDVPVYVTSRRNRALSQQKDDLLITTIPLPTKYFSPAYWIRRNIAITIYSDENDQ